MTNAESWYYGSAGGGQKGPFTRDQMAALLQGGVLNAASLVWSATLQNWTPLGQTSLQAEVPVFAAPPPLIADLTDSTRNEVTGFGEAISACFKKYATFSGRAGRPEFWYFMLFIVIASIVTIVADTALTNSEIGPLNGIFSLGVLLPQLAVIVRRLHDTDRSGWWVFLGLVPLVGTIVLIVFWCQRATPARNRFG